MASFKHLSGVKITIFLLLFLFVSLNASAETVVYGFDGTGKNHSYGDKTNVYRFLEAHRAYGDVAYINGVGAGYKKWKLFGKELYDVRDLGGLLGGEGKKKALEIMYKQLVTNFKSGKKGIVIVGFSRGAALSRQFAHMIQRRGNPVKYRKGKKPRGKAPKIKYMALFDTVYSFGLAAGKRDLGFSKWIPSNVKAVAHATAKDEKRNLFDLWSIHPKQGLPKSKDGAIRTGSIGKGNYRAEKQFKGGHDDVGGAEAYNYLGLAPLKWVIAEGRKAGVRLNLPNEADFRCSKRDFDNRCIQAAHGKGKGTRKIYYPKIPAITYKKAKRGCEGKQVYRSGTKCYRCPTGYKRTSLTRKMTHPKACKERGVGFNKKKTSAKYVWGANGCPKYQFKHKGYCKKCPTGTKRIHVAGIDTGLCKLK